KGNRDPLLGAKQDVPQDQRADEEDDEAWQRCLELREVERDEAPDEEVHEGPVDNLQDPREAPLVEVQVATQQRGDAVGSHGCFTPGGAVRASFRNTSSRSVSP